MLLLYHQDTYCTQSGSISTHGRWAIIHRTEERQAFRYDWCRGLHREAVYRSRNSTFDISYLSAYTPKLTTPHAHTITQSLPTSYRTHINHPTGTCQNRFTPPSPAEQTQTHSLTLHPRNVLMKPNQGNPSASILYVVRYIYTQDIASKSCYNNSTPSHGQGLSSSLSLVNRCCCSPLPALPPKT